MTIPTKSLTNGFVLPTYGLGTWEMGGRATADTSNDTQDILSIKAAIDLGVTHIDTAEKYGDGHAEELIGQAIQSYDRAKLVITTKVAHTHLKQDDVLLACKNSLRRLQTDYIDLYLIHAPNPDIPLKETISALNKLVDRGLIKHIGVSNFSKERLKHAQELSKYPIVCNQVHYNVVYRNPEETGLVEYCQKNDVFLTAFRPLGKRDETVLSIINSLKPIAEKYKKTPTQIALNWLVSQKNVIIISKTTRNEHLEENLAALSWEMKQEDIDYIRTKIQTLPDEDFAVQ